MLDIMLPEMDGFAVCSKIRETSNTHIPYTPFDRHIERVV